MIIPLLAFGRPLSCGLFSILLALVPENSLNCFAIESVLLGNLDYCE